MVFLNKVMALIKKLMRTVVMRSMSIPQVIKKINTAVEFKAN